MKPATNQASRLDVMNFLNEVAADYPQAISFASGRPLEEAFDIGRWLGRIPDFVRRHAALNATSEEVALRLLAQYGRTDGIVNDLIAEQVRNDENILCDGRQIIVTVGCQEAIELCVRSLCRDAGDVVLVRSPTYIGVTGVADLNGIAIAPFGGDDLDSLAEALDAAATALEREGRHARAVYLVPDFDNPTGSVLPRSTRERVIAVCAARGIVVLEDNPYGMFRYEGEQVPTMAALDTGGCVVYLGTYSKTLCPALRVGFAIVPTRLFGDASRADALHAQLSQLKSFITVNTSQLMQALVGGVLLAERGSLAAIVAPAREAYQRKRDEMVRCLAAAFTHRPTIRWNAPAGGFFLVVELPFAVGAAEAEICARDYGVIVMPLAFFALDDRHDHYVRLAFSNVALDAIEDGISRFARFVDDRRDIL